MGWDVLLDIHLIRKEGDVILRKYKIGFEVSKVSRYICFACE